jgi:hypothetical protein
MLFRLSVPAVALLALARAENPPPDPLCLFTNPCKARPKIAVRGCNPCYISMTSEYNDQGATCYDMKDGNLNGQVVTIGRWHSMLYLD